MALYLKKDVHISYNMDPWDITRVTLDENVWVWPKLTDYTQLNLWHNCFQIRIKLNIKIWVLYTLVHILQKETCMIGAFVQRLATGRTVDGSWPMCKWLYPKWTWFSFWWIFPWTDMDKEFPISLYPIFQSIKWCVRLQLIDNDYSCKHCRLLTWSSTCTFRALLTNTIQILREPYRTYCRFRIHSNNVHNHRTSCSVWEGSAIACSQVKVVFVWCH